MSQFERINKINSVLQNSKNAVEIEKFLSVLEISKATFKRDLAYMRDRLNAPIIWDKDGRGYRYSTGSGKYELPGLWFNSSEILALLVMEHLLENLQPGLLTPHIDPMRTSVRALIEKGEHSADEVIDRIRLISLASRDYDIGCFETVSIGLLNRKRLKINYYNRERDEYLGREVSPQRLVHYRENWYLDSWCHLRNDLRTFALEMINTAELLSKTAKNISKKRLDNHFTGSYGIFSGTSDNLAVLKFNPIRARWVKNEEWHPNQKTHFDEDGFLIMEIPYRDHRELMMDIMKFGPDVEVMSPESLKKAIAEAHYDAYTQYSEND